MENTIDIICSFLNLRESDISSFHITEDSVFITLRNSLSCCPFCGSKSFRSKGYYSRTVSVPNTAVSSYTVNLKVNRLQCSDCQHSFSDSKMISPGNHLYSYATINQLMQLLISPHMTFSEAARLCGMSETTAVRLFDKHVHIPRKSLPEALCIDEVYTKNSDFDRSRFSCVFYDFYSYQIVDVVPSRWKNYLDSYLSSMSEEERNSVRFVSIDMYYTYRVLAKRYLKKAIICADSFHVVKHLNDDLRNIRIRIMKSYDRDSIEYYLLKNFGYLLFENNDLDNKAKYNKRLGHFLNKRALLDKILAIDKDLDNGYHLKETYMRFNSDTSNPNIRKDLEDITRMFIEANIREYEEFISILINWKEEIINSFSFYKGVRINSSVAESMNSLIATLLYNTKGIRNSERRRKRIMYCINKDPFCLK